MKLINLIIAAQTTTGGGSLTAPTNVVATAGDGKIKVTWNSVPNAEAYRIQSATDSGFTTGIISVTVSETKGIVVGADNGVARYVRVQALKVGSTPSSYTNATGTYTPTSAPRLDQPVINTIIGTNNGIYVSVTRSVNQEYTLLEVSASPYFDSGVLTKVFETNSTTINASNGVDYFVRVTAKSDLYRDSYTTMFNKSVYKGYNTFTPNNINIGKLSEPIISQVLIKSSTSLFVELIEGDLRDQDYTIELHANTNYSSALFTQTDTLENLTFSGLTAGTPYRLRVRSNASGLTSSNWVNFPDFVLTGDNVGFASPAASGDSNTAGQPYASPGNNYVQLAGLQLDPANFNTPSITVIRNNGIGSSGVIDQTQNEVDIPNWLGYNGAITRNIASYMFGTNDLTIKNLTLNQFLSNYQTVIDKRIKQGFKLIHISPGIPYSGGFGAVNTTVPASNEFMKGNYKSLLGGYAYGSLYDDEMLRVATTASAAYWDSGVGSVHYTDLGYARIANKYAPLVDYVGTLIFSKPPAPVSLSFDNPSNILTITLPTGYIASDCEISYDWDGVGFNSTWQNLNSLAFDIGNTVRPVGTLAVRIKSTRATQPSNVITNSIQYN